ncbi:MAG: IS110 family transposase [Burkholderiaceae bacterium]|nr:IS110 family transposase [Burkholderiaceae bacterium]
MRKKNTVETFDTSIEWNTIGVDIAKYDNTLVAISVDGETQSIERISTPDLLELSKNLKPTTFAIEPCNGANLLSLSLQAIGHNVKTISGSAVKHWVETHCGRQKTDRNDATALAYLSMDRMLKPIRTKSLEQMRMLTIFAVRKQLISCRSSILVSLKGLSQAWGILFSANRRNLRKMLEQLREQENLLTQPIIDSFEMMIGMIKKLDESIQTLEKVMIEQLKDDSRAEKIMKVLGIGLIGTHRLLSTCGNIDDFKGPKSFAAYYGLVPNNRSTGHNNRVGKCSRHGDADMRSSLYQSAAVLFMQNAKKQLRDCALKRWIDKKIAQKMMWGKMMIALAAKLARILWALLKYDDDFDLHRAGVSRTMLEKELN